MAADRMTPELLTEFGEAWNRHDPDLLMRYMADDCRYEASFDGAVYVGRDAVRDGFARFFARYPDGLFVDSRIHVFDGQRAACEWTFVADDGNVSVRGCDLYEFDGGRIRVKSAFRRGAG